MAQEVKFLDMFGCCAALRDKCGGLELAKVKNVVVSREKRTMDIAAGFAAPGTPSDIAMLEWRIAAEYGFTRVKITGNTPAAAPAEKKAAPPKKEAKPAPKKAESGEVLFGKLPKDNHRTDISELTLQSGTVSVTGKVFAADSRKIQKTNAAVLSFDMTDYTGSIHVSKYIRQGDDQSILDKIRVGDYLTVRGDVIFNRYDNDMAIDVAAIARETAPQRQDTAEGDKRVELHLHTRYSTLDALTDPTAAVKTAARWGHRAIAVTDHGVAQAFPEFWHAGAKCGIKVIYGVEGYYINDVDDLLAVHGESDLPLDTDFVGFDIETTGLDSHIHRITEIGAVRVENGVVTKSFQTFVDPGMPIPPEIVQLTGITDRDVYGAPGEAEAVRAFLDFVGDFPLVAHNAAFDIGFITAAAKRSGLAFDPVYIDTLPIAQALLKQLKKFKLDIISNALGLPDFNHHRASDDAAVCARIFTTLRPRLADKGAKTLSDAGALVAELRKNDARRPRHITLLVQNKVGLKNLYELISKSHLEHFKKSPIIPKSLLMQYREGILIGSACEAGEIFDAVVRNRSDAELDRLAAFYDYFEIQPLCNNHFLINDGKARDEEDLREFNRRVLALGRRLGKLVVATGDVHFLEPEDEIYRHILMASRKFPDADKPLPLYFKTTDEMLKEFSYLGEADCRDVVVTAPNAIADSVESFELLPKDLFPPSIPHAAEDLERMVWDKTHELYGENPPELVTTRIKEELDAILGRHYEVIYMSAQKLVQNSLEHGYLVGSRGSVGSSIVAYMSGITEVNSYPPHYRCPNCKYTTFDVPADCACGADLPDAVCPKCGAKLDKDGFNIPFETFLGFGGDKVPDIDLNFSGEYQAKAHAYCVQMFGKTHVFRAGTIGTVAEKTAYGYAKKYLSERGKTVSKAEENRLALGCVNVKRTTGQHPGGLVVIPQENEIWDFCPVQHPADDKDSEWITTHFEYHSMEENLLKLDMLGHDDPTMIRMLEDMTGVDAQKIPLDDQDTMSIFTSSKVLGYENDPILGPVGSVAIPEFGTGFTRGMLQETQPTKFDTLIRLSGFSHGTDVWLGNARDLILSKTASVNDAIGCRDDIMLYLIKCGMPEKRSFKIMEAVRKGRGLPDGAEEEMKAAGVPEWYIGSCKKIKYLFPKAHATAYVMMAFRIAWFKVHQPLAFYAAYFYRRSQKGGFDEGMMCHGIELVKKKLQEIKEDEDSSAKDDDLFTTLEVCYEFYLRGFTFAPIDIYHSHATKFQIEAGQLRPPFVAVAGLGETAAWDLMNAREGREFLSVEEFADACPKVSKTLIDQLQSAGAFGDLPLTSQLTLF